MTEKRKLIVNDVKKADQEYKDGKSNQKKWLWRELVIRIENNEYLILKGK